MGDSEADKAEKLAAARKRFEELKRKKQPGKKGAASTSKAAAAATTTTTSTPPPPSSQEPAETGAPEPQEHAGKDAQKDDVDGATVAEEPVAAEVQSASTPVAEAAPAPAPAPTPAPAPVESPRVAKATMGHGHRQSISSADLSRSSETLPEIYRKQAQAIDELRVEKQHLLDEVTALRSKAVEAAKVIVERDKAVEDVAALAEELQTLKEKSGAEEAIFREGAGEASTLKAEIVGLTREVAHLQGQLAQKDKLLTEMRRESTSNLPQNLRTKEDQLESLSVELSELRAALNQSTAATEAVTAERGVLEAQVEDSRRELEAATRAADELRRELENATASRATDTAKGNAYEAKVQSQERTIAELKKALEGMTARSGELESSNGELRRSGKAAEGKCRDLEKKLSIAQRENNGLQMRLAELRKSSLQSASSPQLEQQGFQDGGFEGADADPSWERKMSESMDPDGQDPFSDVNLRSGGGRQGRSGSILGQRYSIRALLGGDDGVAGQAHPDSWAQRVKEELGRWRGYSLDLVDVYKGYDNAYSGIFDI
ncbi:hypothetical protein DRE_04125 [Drechslerella stenobrocha 248]|uniref:Uncharacterized protein n=1 Tax=Drechslerella stenobrocha 248 TaxID=1043628 RepID=W7I384_9PEZI|nr:hypothetical protein DRE_04125 [Drechslerella stenobrocha 248]